MNLRAKNLRSTFYLLLILVSPFRLYSQALSLDTEQLNFGTVNELNSASRSVQITNNLSRTVTVSSIRFYTIYGSHAFSASSSAFSIGPGNTFTLDVWFSPKHNIFHNSEMVIYNDGLRGCLRVDLTGQGTFSKSYYNASENLAEENLKNALNTITGNGYVSLIYGPARDEMFMVIDNQRVNGQGASLNTIESVYTGAQAVGYTSRTDAQTNFSFNTEHTFPQSFFGSLEPMRSDLHHLFPTDDASNNVRDNDPFGVVNNPSWSVGGSKSNGSLFEPRDEQKGMSARAMFYFVTRYQNYSGFLNSQENILRNWHSDFPPDQVELRRNDDIYFFQNNRNPFVDYPQFVDRISNLSSFSSSPVSPALDITQDTMIYGFVAQNTNADFQLVLVNYGNTNIQLSQFSLSHSGKLSFINSANDTTLNPGEALKVHVRYFSPDSDSIRAWLSFMTNVPGQNNISIPIFVNDQIFTQVQRPELSRIFLSPNPTDSYLQLSLDRSETGAGLIQIFSVSGKLMQEFRIPEVSPEIKLDLRDLVPGMYFLNYRNISDGKVSTLRFVKI